MGMHSNQKKEEFSKAYLHAIAATCGWTLGTWSQDPHKIDSSIQKLIRNADETEEVLHIDFQLKCTESPTTDNAAFVSFTLDDDHYDQLKKRVGGKPLILVVIVVPNDTDHWFNLFKHEDGDAHQSTLLKYCGYIAFISDEGGNYLDETKTIRFYKGLHEFDDDALSQIEQKLAQPGYRKGLLERELARMEALNA